MDNFNNGFYNAPGTGACGTPHQVAAVATMPWQPDVCPAPPAIRLNTDSQARDYQSPRKGCNLELGDIAGNTAVESFLLIGGDLCLETDEEVREAFDLSETIPIIRSSVNCLLNNTTIEGTLTFNATGTTEAIASSLFSQRGEQLFMTVIDFNNSCPFTIKPDFRCAPCDNGDLVQSYGGSGCAPLVLGPERYFGLTIPAGATLEEATICICAYSVPSMISCRTVDSCPPAPPAPPICPEPYTVQSAQVPGAFGTRRY